MSSASSRYIAAYDGLRGLAAIIVVWFHLFETFSQGPAVQILNHGYLAVDFFYLLSGYILCHAYDNRWGAMSLRSFFSRRLSRLHPMIIAGSLVGLLLLAFQACPMFPLLDNAPLWKVFSVFLLGCLLIPLWPGMDIRGWDEMFCLNSPQWTMLYEYLANLAYALFLRKAGKKLLAVLAAIAAFFVADLALNLNLLSIYGDRGAQAYTVIGGWTSTWKDVYIACVRLSFPFLAGMLLYRIKIAIHWSAGPALAAILLAAVLCSPRILPTKPLVNGIYELVSIVVLLPAVLLLGKSAPVGETCQKFCRLFGEFSFPLYLTHFPFVYLQVSLYSRFPDHATLITAGCFLLIVTTAALFTWWLRRRKKQ